MPAKLLKNLFRPLYVARRPLTEQERRNIELNREWDRQLSKAISERDRAEIDAIFSRAIGHND